MGIVSISPQKNRIHIKFLDMSRKEIELTVMKIEVAALELNPNFTCLIDFRLAGSLLMENKDLLDRGQKALIEMGIGKAVTLVTQQQIKSPPFQILDIVRSGYEIEYATSTKSAKRILDNYKREIEQLSKRPRRGNPCTAPQSRLPRGMDALRDRDKARKPRQYRLILKSDLPGFR